MRFKRGDTVYYRLEQCLSIRYIPGMVLFVGPRRITIETITNDRQMRRIVKPENLLTQVEFLSIKGQ